MLTNLAHVCIETNDLEKTETFYRILSLKRQFDFKNLQGELVAFYLAFNNNTYVEVIKTTKPKQPGLIRHFAIEVDDIDAAHQTLLEHGIDVTDKELGIDNTWMITCTDPNGVFIELHEYTADSLQLVGGVCEVDYTP